MVSIVGVSYLQSCFHRVCTLQAFLYHALFTHLAIATKCIVFDHFILYNICFYERLPEVCVVDDIYCSKLGTSLHVTNPCLV